MKLPSIEYLATQAGHSFKRFPLTVISSFIAVCLGIYMIEYKKDITNPLPVLNIIMTAYLAVPLFFCVTVFTEKKKLNTQTKLIAYAAVLIVLFLVWLSLPGSETTHNTSLPYIRYGIFAVIAHLLVSFAPYLNGSELNGFWN